MDNNIEELEAPVLSEKLSDPEILAEGAKSAILCISSLIGFCPPNVMKVKGKIKKKEVVALIYSGASHNFITDKFMTECGIT